MFGMLAEIGNQLARKFLESGQDIFTMVADVEGQEVTVSVKFSPVTKELSREDVWKHLTNSNLKNI